MIRSLVQFRDPRGRGVAALDGSGAACRVRECGSTLELAKQAVEQGRTLAELAGEQAGEPIDLTGVALLLPVDHPDPAHVLVSGTGLTHLGSAEGRNKMHAKASEAVSSGETLTDSMRMFLMGVEGGKPATGSVGAQPEWFYKGDGGILVASGEPLTMPGFAGDAGEEPELAGVYLIDPSGTPRRLGFVLGNEFSDHVTERGNYLWLAHSKLRQAGLAPELLLGELPQDVRGTARIRRGEDVLWEKEFLSGESNMSHTLANLEHHHFKNAQFRRPGSVHVHFLGTATLSYSDGVDTKDGDVFEIEAEPFRLSLRNALRCEADEGCVTVQPL